MTKFENCNDVNDVLSRLLILISRDRVSPRRAAVIADICNLLLRSILPAEERPPEIIVDMPRPGDDTQPTSEPQSPVSSTPAT